MNQTLPRFDEVLEHVISLPELTNDERVVRLCVADPRHSAEVLRRVASPSRADTIEECAKLCEAIDAEGKPHMKPFGAVFAEAIRGLKERRGGIS